MKLNYSNLKSAYARLSTFNLESFLERSRNLKPADFVDFSRNLSDKYLNTNFIFFSKYSPFIALSVYSIILIPSSLYIYNSFIKIQKVNSQYDSERIQIESLKMSIQSLEVTKKSLSKKTSAIQSLLLNPNQVDQLPFAVDDLSNMHGIKIDEFKLLTANEYNSEISGGEDVFSMESGLDPSLESDPGLDPSLAPPGADPGLDPSLAPPGADPGLAPPGADPGLDPSLAPPGADPAAVDPEFDPSFPPGADPGLEPGIDSISDENLSSGLMINENIENATGKIDKEGKSFEELIRVKLIANGNYNNLSAFLSDLTKLGFYAFANSVHFESLQEESQSGDSGSKGLAKLTLIMTIPLLEQ